MFLPLISMITALVVGQQSQSMGATEALRPPPAPAEATTATPETAPQTEGTATAATAQPRMVCRSIPVTGSRFPVRQCRSSQQTEAERAESREMLRRMQGARTLPNG